MSAPSTAAPYEAAASPFSADEHRCSSCGISLTTRGSVTFVCPSCGKGIIGRCRQCRDQSVPYICRVCGFQGP